MTKDRPALESLEQTAEATAAGLAQTAAGAAFQLFREKQFGRLAGFEQLSQVEQDRIFNELVVAYVVLIVLLLEAPDLRVARESRDYLAGLNKSISKAYMNHLKTLGVEANHLRDWEKLIAMRHEEYARDRHDVRAAAMQLESAEKNLDLDDLSKIQLLVPVQAVAIGCHHHICRGNTEGRDDLFKLTLRSLSKFYVELRVRLEGGKITPLTRARAALKRVLRRIGRKNRRPH
ncbi:MAG: hypothetical protein Q8S00_07675 [Deltaproteobacteria bacterium]|nr:hypothetical protein [Deltaproteobacteria bacterium]MDZ4346897.1 hypothetical protein [Candidatus Binatia bacterium]